MGDVYLQEVARRMKRQLRPRDILARLGVTSLPCWCRWCAAAQMWRKLLCVWNDASSIHLPPMDTWYTPRPVLELRSSLRMAKAETACSALLTRPCTLSSRQNRTAAKRCVGVRTPSSTPWSPDQRSPADADRLKLGACSEAQFELLLRDVHETAVPPPPLDPAPVFCEEARATLHSAHIVSAPFDPFPAASARDGSAFPPVQENRSFRMPLPCAQGPPRGFSVKASGDFGSRRSPTCSLRANGSMMNCLRPQRWRACPQWPGSSTGLLRL